MFMFNGKNQATLQRDSHVQYQVDPQSDKVKYRWPSACLARVPWIKEQSTARADIKALFKTPPQKNSLPLPVSAETSKMEMGRCFF